MQENQQPQSPVLSIQLNVDQINVILSQLGKLPYETIFPLMSSIRGQASQQIEQLQAAAQAAAEAQQEESTDTPAE